MFGKPLAILILLAVLVSQLAAFAPGHCDDHTQHCCPVCHASHAPLLGAAPLVAFVPPSVRTFWQVTPAGLPSERDTTARNDSNRGPPFSLAV